MQHVFTLNDLRPLVILCNFQKELLKSVYEITKNGRFFESHDDFVRKADVKLYYTRTCLLSFEIKTSFFCYLSVTPV